MNIYIYIYIYIYDCYKIVYTLSATVDLRIIYKAFDQHPRYKVITKIDQI